MGIKFHCDACRRKLNVKAFLAGKRGICPHCGARVLIPEASADADSRALPGAGETDRGGDESGGDVASVVIQQEAAEPNNRDGADAATPATGPDTHGQPLAGSEQQPAQLDGASRSAAPVSGPAAAEQEDPIKSAPDAKWYVRPPSGGQYGPAEGHIMRKWIAEGRVSADSLVWREGWAEWQPAGPLFAGLLEASPPPQTATAVVHPEIPRVQSAGPRPAQVRHVRRKSSGIGIAIVVILGLMVFLLSIMLLVIVMRQDRGDEASSRRSQSGFVECHRPPTLRSQASVC